MTAQVSVVRFGCQLETDGSIHARTRFEGSHDMNEETDDTCKVCAARTQDLALSPCMIVNVEGYKRSQ